MPERVDSWGIVELMGHVRHVGRVSEEEHFGAMTGRVDALKVERCPECDGKGCREREPLPLSDDRDQCQACGGSGQVDRFTTVLFGAASIYRVTLATEEAARAMVTPERAVQRLGLPGPTRHPWDDEDDVDFGDEDEDDSRDMEF